MKPKSDAEKNAKSLDMLHVFVTDRCNMRCPHCYVDSSGRFDDELTTEEMVSLFRELNSIDFAEGVHIEGGEPFLRKDLVDFLSVLDDLTYVTIATNGTIPYHPRFLPMVGVERIGFSIEGSTQETHGRLRPNNLPELLDNMVAFQNAGFAVQSRTTLTSENYHEIEGIVSADYEREIPIARFQAFTPVGRGTQNQELGLTFEQYNESIKNYIRAVEKWSHKVMVKLSLPTAIAETLDLSDASKTVEVIRTICYRDCNQAAIAANGDVFQCYNLLNYSAHKIGNIREIPFAEIVSLPQLYQKGGCQNSLCVSKEKGYTHLVNQK